MPGSLFRTSNRVELCTVEPEDNEFLRDVCSHPQVQSGVLAVMPVNEPQERDWIESIGEDGDTSLLACVDGEPVGSVTLREPDDIWGVGEVGYAVHPDGWDNGYATDAVEGICRYAFDERRLNKVYGTLYAKNEASQRVLEKVGFTEAGVLGQEAFVDGEHVNLHCYGLLSQEFDV